MISEFYFARSSLYKIQLRKPTWYVLMFVPDLKFLDAIIVWNESINIWY